MGAGYAQNYDDGSWRVDVGIIDGTTARQTGEFIESLSSGYISRDIEARESLKPSIVYNNRERGLSVLTAILDEIDQLGEGDEFWFAVAFVTQGGMQLLIQTLDAARERGVRGRVLTGTYLSFNDPQAFNTLLMYDNIETRIYNQPQFDGLHCKGYYFRHGSMAHLMVGSSNLTETALKGNVEWNLSVSMANNASLAESFCEAFELAWNAPCCYELDQSFVDTYRQAYRKQRMSKMPVLFETTADKVIEPNAMQADALFGLADVRARGRRRALVVSATGTGKTYLAALDVRQSEPKPRRVLFVVHRQRIAADALKSFRRVLGDSYTYGLVGGGMDELDADCVFATVQTLARPETLECLDADAFDYMIVDEVHRAGAPSYQCVLEHFRPRFLLGMSATPERPDGFDIFKLFDYEVAYEIRLQQALEHHLVTPFHYFGVTDAAITSYDAFDARNFADEAHAILTQSRKYGYSGPRLKALVFCSRLEEAEAVSKELCALGARSLWLGGGTTDIERERAMQRLEMDDCPEALDYLVSVDVFNEGIDIPTVNQVIMVRATESAIVFVQQLGRGLRNNPEKDYVTVIDFIGNYDRNYNIPIALFGDREGNKETLRHTLVTNGSELPGTTTVQFDQISRERVLKSINEANFSKVALLRDAYKQLRRRLGRIPTLEDFRTWGQASPLLIFANKNFGCYHLFLKKLEPDYHVELTERQVTTLKFVSSKFANGLRTAEPIAIRMLMEGPCTIEGIADEIGRVDRLYGCFDSQRDLMAEARSAIRALTLEFYTKADRDKSLPFCVERDGRVEPTPGFVEDLKSEALVDQLNEVLDFALHTYEITYTHSLPGTRLCLSARYTRADSCRLLNWDKDEHGTINGYSFKTDDWVVFVTYRKADDISASTRYEDEFVSRSAFMWYSQSNRRLGCTDHVRLQEFDPSRQRIHLFVKRDNKDQQDHYYLGTMQPQVGLIEEREIAVDGGGTKPILYVPFHMDNEVSLETYRYLTR